MIYAPKLKPDPMMVISIMCIVRLLFVDNILMIHHDGVNAVNEIDRFFKTKPNSIGDPDYYLGAMSRPITLPIVVIT
jgi:hypothetical protein